MTATMPNQTMETILIVDDEDAILRVVTEYFGRKGYITLTARNGREALDLVKKHPVDCCFTDINMPGMDGIELAEALHHHDNTLPVIVMTGFPSLENAIQTIKNGVVDFMVKPVNMRQMELCLRRALQQRDVYAENILLKKEIEGKAKLEGLNRELVQKVDELNTLNKILTTFAAIGSTADIFKRAVEMTLEIAHADQALFFVINDSVHEPFEVAAAHAGNGRQPGSETGGGISAVLDPSAAFGTGLSPIVLEVASDRLPLLISDSKNKRGLGNEILSFMAVPLDIRQKVFGVLTAAIHQGRRRFSEKNLYVLSFMTQAAANAIESLALYDNIYENLFSTLYGFVNALEARDLYTRQHSNRVTEISVLIGRELGCSSEEIDTLNFAGHLHDIGKIGIRDDILLKPGRLSANEFEKIKEHPVIGANIVAQMGLWEKERWIIRSHHERFDGTGYPDGISGDHIPFLARILAVADVFDAMASDRAYRKRMEYTRIYDFITGGAGHHFDPRVVSAFTRLYHAGKLQAQPV
jgi:putative nucleotidyltransferase with HDIG domain